MTSRRKRFAILCRVSTRGQLAGVSLDVQIDKGESYVKQVGGVVVERYVFQESARKAVDERRKFNQVLMDGQAGKWDSIWTLDTTRFVRNASDTGRLIAHLLQHGLEWHTMLGVMPIHTPGGKTMAQLMSVMGEHETDTSSWKTRESRQKMMEQGLHAFGQHPWGRILHDDKKTWSVDPKAKQLAQHVYRLYVEKGKSWAEIASLTGEKKTTLIKRMRSAGVSRWKRKLTTPEKTLWFTIDIPPLLTPQQASALERRSKSNCTVLPIGRRKRSLLQGLVRCKHCGRLLTRMPSKKRNADGSYDLHIYRHPPNDAGERCFWHVPADLIEPAIVRACGEIIGDNRALKAAIERGLRGVTAEAEAAANDAIAIRKEVARTEKAMDAVIAELTERTQPGPARERLREKLDKLDARLSELRCASVDASEMLNSLIPSPKQASEVADRIRALCGLNGKAPLLSMTSAQQRLLVAAVVGHQSGQDSYGVYVTMHRFGNKKEVYWNWELRGALAVAGGSVSQYEAFHTGTDVKRIELADNATALQLAQLALGAKPMRANLFTLSS
ncbi:MAG: recombinase family protein [Rhodospirillaceae bacterium]